jgi:CheY-like chemotaxis protein
VAKVRTPRGSPLSATIGMRSSIQRLTWAWPDLNLPRRTGLEIMADLKADQDLLTIPVLILTNSAAPPDIQRSYSLHASAYVAKPADFDGFADADRQIARWFLELVELPRPS